MRTTAAHYCSRLPEWSSYIGCAFIEVQRICSTYTRRPWLNKFHATLDFDNGSLVRSSTCPKDH